MYKKEMESVIPEACMDYSQFTSMVSEKLGKMSFIELKTDDQYGFLYYHYWEDNSSHVTVPEFGYYAESEKMMVRLFRKLAEATYKHEPIEFSIHLYSHDSACIQAMHMMQFGNMSETCIKTISRSMIEPRTGICICELNKERINNSWPEIWHAVHQIILHLTKSPVFYKGEEFTEEVYREFFMDSSVHVIAAIKDERLIGIIEWNEEMNSMIADSSNSVNVGEVFVYPEFRGTGLAQQLLQFAENQAYQSGARFMWVEHGTANPEARSFWNRVFSTYQYELVRAVAD